MNKDFFRKIKEKWQTVLILVFVVMAITFSISTFIPAKYSSEIKMMIIQDHQSEKVDAFSAAKSAEYLSDIISDVVFTDSFMRDVLDAPFDVKKKFPNSSEEKEKVWEKTVDVKKENDTGIIDIRVLEKSKEDAENIAESVAWALSTRGSQYHGGGDSVTIKLINGPVTSEKPAVPNVLVNTLLAFIVGIMGSFSIVYFFDDFELIAFSSNKINRANGQTNGNISQRIEQIREELKKQKTINFIDEDYKIEEKPSEVEVEKFDEVEEAFKNSENLENDKTEEFVRVIEESEAEDKSKKGAAPENLPVFQDEEAEPKKPSDNGFISMEELNKEAEKMGLTGDSQSEEENKPATKYEASSEEVKERLNKLLRGEL